jgi:hypothetical protein
MPVGRYARFGGRSLYVPVSTSNRGRSIITHPPAFVTNRRTRHSVRIRRWLTHPTPVSRIAPTTACRLQLHCRSTVQYINLVKYGTAMTTRKRNQCIIWEYHMCLVTSSALDAVVIIWQAASKDIFHRCCQRHSAVTDGCRSKGINILSCRWQFVDLKHSKSSHVRNRAIKVML